VVQGTLALPLVVKEQSQALSVPLLQVQGPAAVLAQSHVPLPG
jgi:hypothetical protein